MRSLRPLLVAIASAVAFALTTAAGAQADAAGSPAGASAVGAYLDLGLAHGCALQRDRAVRCWGKGASGRLGAGGMADRLSGSGAPDASSVSFVDVAAVTAGDAHTCALLAGGTVRCWGQGSAGQLGSGTRDNRADGAVDPLSGTDEPSTVPLGGPASAISAGGEFTCALVSGGTVRCWGDGAFGALGSGGTDGRLDGLPGGPTDDASVVPLAEPATAVSAGSQHACALLASGAVSCWGNGADGRLGSGGIDDRLDGATPAGGTDAASVVPLAEPATAVSAGTSHTCALLVSGAVSCWGDAFEGRLGTGRSDDRLDGVTPTTTGATDAASTVPLKPVGTPQNRLATTPSLRATAIAAGDAHTCAIVEGGDVRCWGNGTFGRLGQGAVDHRLDTSVTSLADVATRVGGGTNGQTGTGLGAPAIGVTAGAGAVCVELATGAVRCWGSGDDGRLGSGAVDARLDGTVDQGTATDAASVVPVGPLPSVFGDLLTEQSAAPSGGAGGGPGSASTPAAAGPAPSAGATPLGTGALAYDLKLKGSKATVTALLTPTKAGTCPRRVSATVRDGKRTLGRASLKTKRQGASCRATGAVTLRRAVKDAKTVTVLVRGKGVAARTLRPARR